MVYYNKKSYPPLSLGGYLSIQDGKRNDGAKLGPIFELL